MRSLCQDCQRGPAVCVKGSAGARGWSCQKGVRLEGASLFMKSHRSNAFLRSTLLAVPSVGLALLTACGGSGGGNDLGSTPSAATYVYVTTANALGHAVPGAVYQFAIESDGSLT